MCFCTMINCLIAQKDSLSPQNKRWLDSVLVDKLPDPEARSYSSYDARMTMENSYLDTLVSGLKKGFIPNFFYCSCIDTIVGSQYYYKDSHHYFSLRSELIKKLTDEDLRLILKIGDKRKLKKKCQIKRKYVLLAPVFPNLKYSTLQLIKRKQKKLIIED